MPRPLPLRHLASLVALAACPAVGADVTKAEYQSHNSFDYRLIHMPDLDQIRSGLPNGGSNFCVPTTYLNVLGYCANHGFPMVYPGPHNWQSQANYDLATNAIALIGANMGTDPGSGTTNAGWQAGADAMLILGGGDQLTTAFVAGTAAYRPFLSDIAYHACAGALVVIGYRRYNVVGYDQYGVPILSGSGGHAMCLARCRSEGNNTILTTCDPADASDGPDQQSPFVLREFTCTHVGVQVGNSPTSHADAMDYRPGDSSLAMIYNELVVGPKQGYSFTNTGTLSTAILHQPFRLPGTGTPGVHLVAWPGSGTILDAVPTWDGGGLVAIELQQDGKGHLRQWSPTGGMTVINDDIDARSLCVGRGHQLYVGDSAGKLICLDGTNDYAILAATSNAPPISAMAFDDETDQLFILSVPLHRVARFPKNLAGGPTNLTVPASVPMSGQGSIAAEPGTPLLWFTTDASNGIYSVDFGSPSVGSIFDAAIVGPKGISFDDLGHLFVSRALAGTRTVLELENTKGEWAPRPGSAFTGMPCGNRCEITRSRSDFDPATAEPFVPDLALPDLVVGVARPPCDADLDGSGGVDAADLAIFLGQWGTSSTLADIDGSGAVDAGDLGLLLGEWGPC